jgi:hypothetical protein
MNRIEQYGFVKDGELKILGRKRMDAQLKDFPNCDVQVIIKRKGKRSNPQNRYYWGIVVEEIRLKLLEFGDKYTPEEIHEGLKAKFNPKGTADVDGGAIFITGSTTTEMNKEEFGAYLDLIIKWAAESLGITIPEAGEQTKLFTDEQSSM